MHDMLEYLRAQYLLHTPSGRVAFCTYLDYVQPIESVNKHHHYCIRLLGILGICPYTVHWASCVTGTSKWLFNQLDLKVFIVVSETKEVNISENRYIQIKTTSIYLSNLGSKLFMTTPPPLQAIIFDKPQGSNIGGDGLRKFGGVDYLGE